MTTTSIPVVSASVGGLGSGGVSGFTDVDASRAPMAYVESLQRRAGAALYDPYCRHVDELLEATTGIICDVGCGIGTRLSELRARGRDCVGVDASWTMLSSCCQGGVQASGYFLPFRRACMGAAVVERVLQHCVSARAVVDQVAACVRPGGLVICIDPIHSRSMVLVGGAEELCGRVNDWRRLRGVACPDAAVVAEQRGLRWGRVSVAEFVCQTGQFGLGRQITDFPNWARHAQRDGWAISQDEVVYWEDMFSAVLAGERSMTLTYPVQVTAIWRQ